MPGGAEGSINTCDLVHDPEPTYEGKLCDHEHGRAVFGPLVATWSHAIKAWLPEEVTDLKSFAKFAPLLAAVIAPTSTLLDIPALSQHWYTFNGKSVPDPKACFVLSAVGLTMNVIANLLLVVRFSHSSRRNHAVVLSLVFWAAKTIIALVNLCVFAAWSRNDPEYQYDQAFWCATISLIMAGMCTFCLLFHYLFAFGLPEGDREDLRMTGRKFMLSETFFVFLLGMQALAFNRLEHWTYVDSIYFSLQCALTIGYGDLPPQTAAGKVLVFPFAVLTISQLANEVSIIIEFVQNRAQEKRDRWRKRFSRAMHREAIKRKPFATLVDEMSLIHQIDLHQEIMQETYDLIWSAISLCTFWLVGAAMFNSLEGWGYGVYAVMVLSLTIGFGDYTPETPAGRVVWIVYALMAVPIVTNFAVQTVTGIMYTWSEHRYTRARFQLQREDDPEAFAPHSHFILKNHRKWDKYRDFFLGEEDNTDGSVDERDVFAVRHGIPDGDEDHSVSEKDSISSGKVHSVPDSTALSPSSGPKAKADRRSPLEEAEDMQDAADDEIEGASEHRKDGRVNSDLPAIPAAGPALDGIKADAADAPEHLTNEHLGQLESKLLHELIDRITRFEAQSRQMLVDTMDRDLARTLLLADRNLQIRDAFHLYDDHDGMGSRPDLVTKEEEKEMNRRANIIDSEAAASSEDMVSRVRRYRNAFAEILVISSTLLRLEGEDLKRFERWRVNTDPKAVDDFKARTRAREKKHSRTRKHLQNAGDWVHGRPHHKRKPKPPPGEEEDADEREDMGATEAGLGVKKTHRRHESKGKHRASAEDRLADDMDTGDSAPEIGMGIRQGALPLPSAVMAAYRARRMRFQEEGGSDSDTSPKDKSEQNHVCKKCAQEESKRRQSASHGRGRSLDTPRREDGLEPHGSPRPTSRRESFTQSIRERMFHDVGEHILQSADKESTKVGSLGDWMVDKGAQALHMGHKTHRLEEEAKLQERARRARKSIIEDYEELKKHDHGPQERGGGGGHRSQEVRTPTPAGDEPAEAGRARRHSRSGAGSGSRSHPRSRPDPLDLEAGGDAAPGGRGAGHAADPIHNAGAQADAHAQSSV